MVRRTPGVSHPNLAKIHMVANPRGYPRAGPRGHTWENPTLYAWPDLRRVLPISSCGRNILSPSLGEAQGAVPSDKPHFTHGPTYTGCFPPQASRHNMVANPKGYLRAGPTCRTRKKPHFTHGPTYTGRFPPQAFEKPAWSPILRGTLGQAQGAVPRKNRTLYAWPDLHRVFPTPSLRNTTWSTILGGTRWKSKGPYLEKTTLYAWPDLHRALPIASFEKPYGRQC